MDDVDPVTCLTCRRPLSDPVSRAVGRGPVCQRGLDHIAHRAAGDQLALDITLPTPHHDGETVQQPKNAQFKLIARTIAGLAGASAADGMTVHRRGVTAWEGSIPDLAEEVRTALFGTDTAAAESPLQQAEAAKRRRDLPGEIDALMHGAAQLESAPWYPLRPGDLVHIGMEPVGDVAAWGETYLIGQGTEAGQLWMRLLHHTPSDDPDLQGLAGAYAGCSDEPLYDAWFEAGPQRITVVRDGAPIPNQARR
jgi:hypothetical protein